MPVVGAQEFEVRWRLAQARLLSALRLGAGGLRTLRPIRRHPLPPPAACTSTEENHDKQKREAPKARRTLSLSDDRDGRDVLSAEESREEALLHPHPHAEYSEPILEVARPGRTGGRGRTLTLGDPHRSWGRGWGSAMPGRRAVAGGVRAAPDWMGRMTREEDDSRREGGRRRLMRSDLSQRMASRGRRAVSAESRSDPRRVATRVFHEYDRSEGFTGYREDESGALLVEFNDVADVARAGGEAAGIEGGSAASADSGDTSQDGDEMVRSVYGEAYCVDRACVTCLHRCSLETVRCPQSLIASCCLICCGAGIVKFVGCVLFAYNRLDLVVVEDQHVPTTST